MQALERAFRRLKPYLIHTFFLVGSPPFLSHLTISFLTYSLTHFLLLLNESQEHKVREKFVAALEEEFPDMGLKFSIGKPEQEAVA